MNLLLISAFLVLLPVVVIGQSEQTFNVAVRDLVIGARPPNVKLELYRRNENKCGEDDEWIHVASNVTNTLMSSSVTPTQFPVGYYKLIVRTGKYYESRNVSTFYPYLEIVFKRSTQDKILVVISLSPYGYIFFIREILRNNNYNYLTCK